MTQTQQHLIIAKDKKMKPFSLTVGRSLGAFLALSALSRADWFTEQGKPKPGTTRVLKLFDFQLHFRGVEGSPEDTKAELHG